MIPKDTKSSFCNYQISLGGMIPKDTKSMFQSYPRVRIGLKDWGEEIAHTGTPYLLFSFLRNFRVLNIGFNKIVVTLPSLTCFPFSLSSKITSFIRCTRELTMDKSSSPTSYGMCCSSALQDQYISWTDLFRFMFISNSVAPYISDER